MRRGDGRKWLHVIKEKMWLLIATRSRAMATGVGG